MRAHCRPHSCQPRRRKRDSDRRESTGADHLYGRERHQVEPRGAQSLTIRIPRGARRPTRAGRLRDDERRVLRCVHRTHLLTSGAANRYCSRSQIVTIVCPNCRSSPGTKPSARRSSSASCARLSSNSALTPVNTKTRSVASSSSGRSSGGGESSNCTTWLSKVNREPNPDSGSARRSTSRSVSIPNAYALLGVSTMRSPSSAVGLDERDCGM